MTKSVIGNSWSKFGSISNRKGKPCKRRWYRKMSASSSHMPLLFGWREKVGKRKIRTSGVSASSLPLRTLRKQKGAKQDRLCRSDGNTLRRSLNLHERDTQVSRSPFLRTRDVSISPAGATVKQGEEGMFLLARQGVSAVKGRWTPFL